MVHYGHESEVEMKPELAEKITLVLLTFNSSKFLERTLDHLLTLELPIVAVDNASSDTTVEMLRRHPEIDVIALPKNIGATARNYGVERARTPYVAFCDDDTWYEWRGLKVAADVFDKHPHLGVITARILVKDDRRLDPISHLMAQSPLPDEHGLLGKVLMSYMAGASIMRKTAYIQSGGYDYRFFMGAEEETLAWKMARRGWQMRYLSSIVCYHYPSLQNFQNMRHWGLRNTIVNAWLHRPLPSAIRWTAKKLWGAPKNVTILKALKLLVGDIGWIMRERSVMDPKLEAALQTLEEFKPEPYEDTQPQTTPALTTTTTTGVNHSRGRRRA
jgi:N-acetylglucosaminyl-diphospho-decaprenol L-rhamnosyltransferase